MNRVHAVVVAVLVAATESGWAQPVCQRLESAIRAAEMTMSYELASGLLDNSAPRESARQAKIANAWASVHASLSLMQMNKCPAYSRPISEGAYDSAAMKCYEAVMRRLRENSSGQNLQQAPECKRDSWARSD